MNYFLALRRGHLATFINVETLLQEYFRMKIINRTRNRMSKNVGIYRDIHTEAYTLPHIQIVLYNAFLIYPSSFQLLSVLWECGLFFSSGNQKIHIFTLTLEHAIAKNHRTAMVFRSILPKALKHICQKYSYNSAREIICFVQLE